MGKLASEDGRFIRRVCLVVGIVAAALLAWQLRIVLVLLFGAVVVATVFRAIAEPLRRYCRLPAAAAVMVAALLLFAMVGGAIWMFGAQIANQADLLRDAMPPAIEKIAGWPGGAEAVEQFKAWTGAGGSQVRGVPFATIVSTLSEITTDLLIVIFGGLFLATDPRFYRTGAIKLVPKSRRGLIAEAIDESGTALRLWLKGQVMAMAIIGLMTGVGLWLIGVPSALVLGILAGFFEFIPFAGPILSAIPGVLLALAHSPELALWAIGVYVFVQHFEAYLIQPLIQQYAVDIPAVVLLFSLLALGGLFGGVGIIFAAPLTVVAFVLVKRLYVIEALDTPTPIPGEKAAEGSRLQVP